MKTFLCILVIVLVGVLVSGALYLIVENTSILSDASGFSRGAAEIGERPEMPTAELGERTDEDHDDHHATSLSRGLSEIGVSLAKITGITIVVLLIQGIFTWSKKWLPKLSSQSALSSKG